MAPALVLVSAAALLALAASWLLARAATRLVWRPRAVTARFRAQGVRGPPYRFLRGTLDEMKRMKAEGDGVAMDVRDHDILPRIMPHFLRWKEQYGTQFLYWFGPQPRIFLSDYDSVRQILSNKSGHFLKTDAHPTILAMLGKGLVLVEGTDWVRHRRVVNPAFAMDKLKMMTTTMVSCAECLIKEWQDQASNSKSGETEVEFSKQFQELTANVISRTAFGSSYKEGKEVFHAQKQLLAIAMATLLNVPLPGFKYLPTKRNRSKWMLEKKLKTTLMTIIQSRLAPKGGGYGDDLLVALAISWLWDYVIVRLIWRPYIIAKKLREQGISGPPYMFFKGCNEDIKKMKEKADSLVLDVHDHNYLPRIAPHYLQWRTQYGEPFVYWFGSKPRICIFDYELARQILSSKSGHFLKNDSQPTVLALLGKGLVLVEGIDWVRHRRVINPAFAMDKLKMMTKTMVACARNMVKELEHQASKNKSGETQVELDKQFQELTADIISRTAFGSSYKLGMEAFHAQKELQEIAVKTLLNMTMVLLETLRLYGPAIFTQRKTTTDMALGETKIPKGFGIIIPFAILHRDKKIWGDDVDEFNPSRFQNGVTKAAKVPHALLAFSIGPRSCIGQNFAMLEAKSVMAVILQKFSFTLSPDYKHAPVDLLTLQPKYGLPVVLRLLDA
ncbi:hypothetical protein EJB05_06449 [Eragrostis curvula]|uniref:Cytochrome P450 n=1 Tax=Eragrostis curvula TaxID=38414 RepID=A0A5J9WG95_9POAL|nr:hypothetical protein EJB05_06449 [Eragrostis curvula]